MLMNTSVLPDAALHYFYQNAPTGFQSLNDEGILIDVNNAWLSTFGYVYNEVIGLPFSRFLIEDQRSKFEKNFSRFKLEKKIKNVEYEMVTKSGQVVHVAFSGKCVYDNAGKFLCTYCIFQDQTQLRETEIAYKETKKTARALIDASADAAFLIKTDGTFVYLNDHAALRLGEKSENLRKKNAFDYLPEELKESRKKMFAEVVEKRTTRNFSETRDGLVLDNHISPILDSRGNVKLLALYSKDITPQLREKEQIEKLNLLNKKLLNFGELEDKLNIVTQGIVDIFDADFSRIWVSKPCDFYFDDCPYWKVYTVNHSCDPKKGCLHLISSSGRYKGKKGNRQRIPNGCMKIGEILTGEESILINNDILDENTGVDKGWAKQTGLKSFAGFRLDSEEGIPIGVLILFSKNEIDQLTLQKLTALANTTSHVVQAALKREELKELSLKQNEAVRASNVGIWDWELNTNRVSFSATWKKQTGVDDIEISDSFSEWENRVHPDDLPKVLDLINNCICDELDGYHTEYRFKHADGSYRNILANASLVKNHQGRGYRFIGSHIDITEIRRIENELRQANATKDKFFSIMAHDLKGPIGGLLELSKLMIDDKQKVSGENRMRISSIMNKSLENVSGLLENLLTWSRAQRGLIELKPEVFNIYDYFIENISVVSHLANSKEIEIVTETEQDLQIFADWDTLCSLLRNLLTNAIKFTKRNGRVTLGAQKMDINNEMVEIWVSDTGVGIRPETVQTIFNLGANSSTSGTENEMGTGLGLILCEEFARKNGGSIRVESELEKGSKFIFSVPMAK